MKYILTAVLLAGFVFNGQAQRGPHIGAHGLLNASFILNQNSYGLEEYDYQQTFGAGAGLVLGYNVTDHIGFQTELNLVKLGQNYQRSKTPVDYRKYSLNYVAFPVLFKYTSGEGMVRFYGQIGPQFMFLTDASVKYLDSAENVQAVYNAPAPAGGFKPVATVSGALAKPRFNKSNVGLNFGLGANIHVLPSFYVNAGLSFYYGFSDINSDAATTDPLAYYAGGTGNGTWQWPDLSLGKYEPSRNAYGGLDIGVHYIFLQ